MDALPDEILEKILNYAMIKDAPFCIETCFRAAEAKQRKTERKLLRRDHWGNMYEGPDAKKLEGRPNTLENRLSTDQIPHLLDWRAVVGTCRRIRRIGKSAFFSEKVFVIGSRLASQLQNLRVTRLSVEDQRIAVQSISSIIWTENSTASPSSYLTLSRHISGFPRLKRLDHLFGHRLGEPDSEIIRAAQNRRQAWSHFTDVLALIGINVGRLDVGIMTIQDTTWDEHHERDLKNNIYPALRTVISMKATYAQKEI